MNRFITASIVVLVFGALTPVFAPLSESLSAQSGETANPDSLALHEQAKDSQARFERFREERIPPELPGFGRGCDDLVGRFCLRFEDGETE